MNEFRFRFFNDDWLELGEFETSEVNWSRGDEFATSDGRTYRIPSVVPLPEDVGIYDAFWKVKPVRDGMQRANRARTRQPGPEQGERGDPE